MTGTESEVLIIKRSPSEQEVEEDPEAVERPEEPEMAESERSVVSGLDSPPPAYMLLPLPLDLQSLPQQQTNVKKPKESVGGRKIIPPRQTVSPASSSSSLIGVTRGGVLGSHPCNLMQLPSPLPSVDLMTALATLKAEFIQNYIVAMINRKVSQISRSRVSISSMFYSKLLHEQIPKAQKECQAIRVFLRFWDLHAQKLSDKRWRNRPQVLIRKTVFRAAMSYNIFPFGPIVANKCDHLPHHNVQRCFRAGVGNSFGFAGHIRDKLGIRGPKHAHLN